MQIIIKQINKYYVYNTTHETLEIEERAWVGVRVNGWFKV